MLGSATANAEHFPRVQKAAWYLGHAVSPDDAWLGSRGLRTLGVRLKQHEENALVVANWLKAQPQVGRVLHPALSDCPGHEYWKRDFSGASGLFSFELKDADAKTRAAFIDSLTLFGIGFSWGGYESLVLPVDPVRTASEAPAPYKKRRHLDEAVDVVGPSVEQNDGGTVARAGLGITNVQQSRFDLLEGGVHLGDLARELEPASVSRRLTEAYATCQKEFVK